MLYTKIYNNRSQEIVLHFPASQWDLIDATAMRNTSPLQPAPILVLPNQQEDQCRNLQSALNQIHGGETYLYELATLDAQLKNKNLDELKTIDALVAIHKPESIGAISQLTENLDQVMWASNIHSPAELGKFLVVEELVTIPEQAIPYLDFHKIGEQYLIENNAVIANEIYYEDPVDRKLENSDPTLLTDPTDMDTMVFQINVGGKDVAMELPTPDEEICRLLEKITDQTQPISVSCAIDRLYLSTDHARVQDLSPLNELATQISTMDQAEYVKFMAVQENKLLLTPSANRPNYHERINKMCEIANNLESYHFENTITTASDYARELLTEAGQEHLIPHMNLKSYGEQKLTEIGGMASSYGIVSTQPLELSHSEQQEFTQAM